MLKSATRRLVSILQDAGMLPGSQQGELPPPGGNGGREVRSWAEDGYRLHPTVGLTPGRMLSILHAASAGSPQMLFELYGEMLQKWPRLAAVEQTRRLALTGLDWEVMPADGRSFSERDRDAARRAADYCNGLLGHLDAFRDVIDHLAAAIGHGISAAEIVWESGRLVDLVPVPMSRLTGDVHDPWRVRVRTAESPNEGVAIERDAQKWVVHQPRSLPAKPFDGGLLRATAMLYLAQNLSFKDWLVYSQVVGMPMRIARFEPGTPEADKAALLKMLERLGTDAAAVLSKTVDLKFVEANDGAHKPYQPLQEYCNNEVTILWLGQHLTTDIKSGGSRAAADVHDRVREDLLVDDIKQESETLRRDLLRPMVRARFGDDAATPFFHRPLIQSVDTKVLADTLAVAVRELGLQVPSEWVHRSLGIPQPRDGEPVLEGGAAR